MPKFTEGDKAFFNLNHVHTFEKIGEGKYRAYDKEGNVIDDVKEEVYNVIVDITPLAEPWECLIPCKDLKEGYLAVPIMAWAYTAAAEVVPITAHTQEPMDALKDYAVRQTGKETVYFKASGIYKNAEDWLEQAGFKRRLMAAE
jgi:hypothetical protein